MYQTINLYVHFAITDAEGNAVVFEFIYNEITYVPSFTYHWKKFFLTPGEYYSHVFYIFSEADIETFRVRYNIIKERLEKYPTMTREQVRDTFSASPQESVAWSIVFW